MSKWGLAVLAWLSAVAVVSGATWWTTSTVGQQLAGESVQISPTPMGASSTPEQSRSASATRTTKSKTPATVSSAGSVSRRPPIRPPNTRPPIVTRRPPVGPPAGVSRVLRVPGATIVATCRGSQLSLDSVTPDDGWSYRVQTHHGQQVVRLSGAGHEREIGLACQSGNPVAVAAND